MKHRCCRERVDARTKAIRNNRDQIFVIFKAKNKQSQEPRKCIITKTVFKINKLIVGATALKRLNSFGLVKMIKKRARFCIKFRSAWFKRQRPAANTHMKLHIQNMRTRTKSRVCTGQRDAGQIRTGRLTHSQRLPMLSQSAEIIWKTDENSRGSGDSLKWKNDLLLT